MVRMPKCKLLNKGIIVGCLLCVMLMLVNTRVDGVSKTYVIKSLLSALKQTHYYFYVPTGLAYGEYICGANNYINSADALTVKPYPVWVKYVYHLDGQNSKYPANLAISNCSANGTIDSTSTITKTIGGDETFTGYIAVNQNESLIFDYYTGRAGNNWFESQFSIPGYVQITVQLDEAAPDKPGLLRVKPGNGKIVISDGKIYTNNDDVVLVWNKVADNKTEFEGHQIGTDWASQYLLNVDGNDVGYIKFPPIGDGSGVWCPSWRSTTEQKLSDINKREGTINSEGTYQIKIKARDYEKNESDYSDPITLVIDRSVTQPTLAANPVQIATNSQKKYNVTFNWNAVTDISGFKYQVALSHSAIAPSDYEIRDVTTEQYTFSNLDYVNNPYYAYVRTVDGVGNISPWTRSNAFVLASPATTITKITANSKLQNSQPSYAVTLTLENVGADTYVIERKPDGAAAHTAVATLTQAQLTANSFKYTDSANLVKHGKYTYYAYTKSSLGSISAESNKTVTVANIPAAIAITDSSGTQHSGQITINRSSYSFGITPKQDSEGDRLKFRVKYYPTGNSSQAKYSSDSNDLQTGPVTVDLAEGSWSCQLEAGEFVDGVELADSSYTRPNSAVVKVIVDLSAPPTASNSFVIKSISGDQTYDTVGNPTPTTAVKIAGITLKDNSGGTGVKGIYLWNGAGTTRPTDAVYQSKAEAAADIAWTLPTGDGIKTVTMQVLDNAGNQALVTYQVKLDVTAPAIPVSTGFTHTISDSLMHFAWQVDNANGDVAGFQGQYTLPNGTVTNFNVAAVTSNGIATAQWDVPVTGLNPNLPVKLKVLAFDQAGNQSAYSDEYIAYTKAALGTLANLTSGYDSSLKKHYLKWQLTSGAAASYLLEYGSVTANGFTVLGSLSPDTGGIIIHSGLTAHGTYSYRLVALNGSNDRTEGTVLTRQVPNTAPNAPVLQAPLGFGRNGAEFKYAAATDGDGDTITYHIYLQGTGGSFTELPDTTVSGLVEGQTYAWYVIADDGYEGKTQSSVGQFTVDNTAPTLTVEDPRRLYTNQTRLTVKAGDPLSGIATVSYQKIAADTNQVTETGTITLTSDSSGNLTGQLQLAEGYYHLQITAYDKSGNSTLAAVNNLKVDQTAPQLTNARLDLTPVDGSYYSTGTLPVQFNATDSYSGVSALRYWILEQSEAELGTGRTIGLSSSVQHYAQKINLAGTTGKTYYLKLAVADAAGNRSIVSGFGPVTLDRTAPEVTINLDGLKTDGTGYYLSDLKSLVVNSQAADSESGIAATTYAISATATNEMVAGWGSWDQISKIAFTAGTSYYITIKAVNRAGMETQQQSVAFTYDNTAPQNLKLTGPSTTLTPGEQVTFTVTAADPESALTEYRLALGTSSTGSTELSSLITGNSKGWLVKESSGTTVQFRFQVPTAAVNGTYYPIVKVTNAAGLVGTSVDTAVTIDNTQEKLSVSDQGPYTQFGDRLTGWWQYLGSKAVSGYQYRIIDQDNQTIRDWTATTKTEVAATGLDLTNGKQYSFEVKAAFADGSTLTGSSSGVTVDTTIPQNVNLTTPEYTTSGNLRFQWQATDAESGIAQAWVALGSDYYQTDVTGGWLKVSGNSAQLTRDVHDQLLTLKSGSRYYLTLRVSNGAGLITEQANPGIMIDDTAPPTPVVVDQGAYINPARQPLLANWIWTETDAQSGLASYQWALIPYGETAAAASWTDGGTATSLSINRTDLTDGATYYFAVKATNRAGLSSIGYSDGIMMDRTAPVIPTVTLLQAVNLGDAQEAVYVTDTANMELAIETYDLSGISSYQYTYDTQAQVTDNTDYSTSTESQFAVAPTLEEGEVTIFKSVCSDGATNISQAGYSSGVILDSGAPRITKVNGTVSGNNLIFDWEVIASSAPVAFYEYALVPEAQGNDTPSSWTKIGLQQSITINGTDLTDGNYRLIVRGCSAAGVYSRREGTIDEWGVSPKVTLDRQPPVMAESKFSYPSYAADQMTVGLAATDELSGIGGYQYSLGSKTDPQQYSGGWVDVAGEAGTVRFTVPTKAVAHAGEVYLMVRAKDRVGQWSTALVSNKIIVDHTLPTTPAVTCGGYTASLTQVSGISYQSTDPESGVTHCRWGIVKQEGAEWLVTPQETPIAEFTGILTGLTLEEGRAYQIAVQTRNGAGEWSAVGYSQAVIADTIVPELTFTKADSTIVLNAPPLAIEYSLTEAANLQFTLSGADGGAQATTAVGQAGLNYYTFTASTAQTYQLSVVPTDLAGNIGLSKFQSIRVNAPPQITLPQFNTTPGAALKLTATVTDLDGMAVGYQWDPGDGGPTLTEAEPTHRYYQTGTYSVKLLVTDNDGGVSAATTTVTVANTTSGSLQGDETWSGTHHLYRNVTVPSGINLTIAPGTVIIADSVTDATSGYALIISGNLTIQGADQGIVFQSTSGQVNGWQGIQITGNAVLEGITVQEAVRGITVEDGANVILTNCLFQNNQVGLHVYNNKSTVKGCSFLNNSLYGIKEDEGGRPVVIDCVFTGNGINYYHDTLTDISIEELNQLDSNGGNH